MLRSSQSLQKGRGEAAKCYIHYGCLLWPGKGQIPAARLPNLSMPAADWRQPGCREQAVTHCCTALLNYLGWVGSIYHTVDEDLATLSKHIGSMGC